MTPRLVLVFCLWSVSAIAEVRIQSAYFHKFEPIHSNNASKQSMFPFDCVKKCFKNWNSCGGWQLTPDGECRLLSRIASEGSDFARATEGGTYLRPISCKNVHCQNGGQCKEDLPGVVDRRGYQCQCRCGTCGPYCEYLHFAKLANKGIYKKNIKEVSVAQVNDCLQLCMDEEQCKSVDFEEGTSTCFVNTVSHFDGIPLEGYRKVNYYYPNCTCPKQ